MTPTAWQVSKHPGHRPRHSQEREQGAQSELQQPRLKQFSAHKDSTTPGGGLNHHPTAPAPLTDICTPTLTVPLLLTATNAATKQETIN